MPVLTNPEIENLEKEIAQKKKELAKMRLDLPPVTIEDYTFNRRTGEKVKLSDLFEGHPYLVLIHNMGQSCKYCTMWANGFEGIYKHFSDKAGFVLVNNDSIDTQTAFAEKQGWTFPMVSAVETNFVDDLGFKGEKSLQPGVSTLRKDSNGKIQLLAQAMFGPGDDFCSVWHFYDMLPEEFNY